MACRVVPAGAAQADGLGTGIAARQFQAVGCRVLGVDPDARMAYLARRFGVKAEVAKFEDQDPAGRAFDAVIAGQAWHSVDPVGGGANAAQVLRPGGRHAVFWNSFRSPADVDRAFAEVWHRVFGSPFSLATLAGLDAYSAMCTKAADGMRQAGAFGDSEEWRFDWDRPYTRDQWLEVVPTFGGFSQYPPAKQQELLMGIGGAIDALGAASRWATPQWWLPRRGPAPHDPEVPRSRDPGLPKTRGREHCRHASRWTYSNSSQCIMERAQPASE